MTYNVDTKNMTCRFGKHSGKLFSEIPLLYLEWMLKNNHSKAHLADAEIMRRELEGKSNK
jgi:uncharacterized protein (DUF3820 family)